jgi:hypothetical protein
MIDVPPDASVVHIDLEYWLELVKIISDMIHWRGEQPITYSAKRPAVASGKSLDRS